MPEAALVNEVTIYILAITTIVTITVHNANFVESMVTW